MHFCSLASTDVRVCIVYACVCVFCFMLYMLYGVSLSLSVRVFVCLCLRVKEQALHDKAHLAKALERAAIASGVREVSEHKNLARTRIPALKSYTLIASCLLAPPTLHAEMLTQLDLGVRILTHLNLNFQIEQRLEAEVQRRESCERVCESLHGQLRSVKNEMEAQVCMRVWVGVTGVHECRPHLFACMQKWNGRTELSCMRKLKWTFWTTVSSAFSLCQSVFTLST
jgi:hypothetical protein